jgi:NADH-quinone oxidoreductase subunit J
MNLFGLSSMQTAGGQIALAAILAFYGISLLLPQSRGRSVGWGIAALIAAVTVFVVWLQTTFGNPMPDLIGAVLFWLFSICALVFGVVLVVQHNPSRGAIAFAFVILSTCGLFLLLAATFLMVATIIIYAGAIIVTFLFVLMLSHPKGLSNENDRTCEPLFGTLAGFAFAGLVLFTLYLNYLGNGESNEVGPHKKPLRLPIQALTDDERIVLAEVITKLDAKKTDEHLTGDLTHNNRDRLDYFDSIRTGLIPIVGDSSQRTDPRNGSIRDRLEKEPGREGAGQVLYREDQQSRAVLERARKIRKLNVDVNEHLEAYLMEKKGRLEDIKGEIQELRDEVVLLRGSSELPARNVENLGFQLYADRLLAIELSGTLLLVAAIGAVAIARRKGVTA